MSLTKHLNRFLDFIEYFRTTTDEYCQHIHDTYIAEINTTSIFGEIVQETCGYYY